MYIWSLDLSLSCSGLVIFDSDCKVIEITSIETDEKLNTGKRLEKIGETILDYKQKFPPMEVAIESGFSRFNKATQQIFRVHGLINYLLSDIEQIYYSPKEVKKYICGNGNAKKELVREKILETYKKITFHNDDESDAFAVGLCHFYKKGNMEEIKDAKKNKKGGDNHTGKIRKNKPKE